MAANELLSYVSVFSHISDRLKFGLKIFYWILYWAQAKRVALYMARTCPNRLLDELMTELQTVETLNCLIERTETPPFYRLTSMRKASSHSDGNLFSAFVYQTERRAIPSPLPLLNIYMHICLNMSLGPTTGANDSRIQELTVEKGTIHTKRHSGEDPIKTGYVIYNDKA